MHNRMGACKTGIGHMKEDPLPRKKVSHKKRSTQPCQPFNLFLRIKAVKQTRGYSIWEYPLVISGIYPLSRPKPG
jgi:hypothetical protein